MLFLFSYFPDFSYVTPSASSYFSYLILVFLIFSVALSKSWIFRFQEKHSKTQGWRTGKKPKRLGEVPGPLRKTRLARNAPGERRNKHRLERKPE